MTVDHTPTGRPSRRPRVALVVALAAAVLVLAGAGYALYAAGHEAGQSDGYATGQTDGERRVGERHGERVGFEHGRELGLERGQEEGTVEGAQVALGGFEHWIDDRYYVVTVQPAGQPGVPYRIATRTTLEPATNYRLCERDEGRLCSLPAVVAEGG